MATKRQRVLQEKKQGRGSAPNVAPTSSSRQPRAPRPVARSPNDIDARYQPRVNLELLRKKPVVAHRTLVFAELAKLGFGDQVNDLLTADWKSLFQINSPVYKHLCEEFFGSFRMDPIEKQVDKSSMTFRLGGTTHTMSFADFGVHMGLYTEEEVQQESFKHSLASWPKDVDAATFWNKHSLAKEGFRNNIKQASMTNPFYRILLRGIAESISNRGSCQNNVTRQDLFYLYCIIERKPCNLAKCLALYLYDKGHGKDKGPIVGGSFVCHLAFQLQVVSRDHMDRVDGMAPIARVGLLDRVALRHMGIVEKENTLVKRYRDGGDSDFDEEDDAGDDAESGDSADHVALPSDLMSRFSALECSVQQVSEQQRLILSHLGRVMYHQDYYQPAMQRMLEKEAATFQQVPPRYAPPALFQSSITDGGFYNPPTSYSGNAGTAGLVFPVHFGTYPVVGPSSAHGDGGADEVDDMQQ